MSGSDTNKALREALIQAGDALRTASLHLQDGGEEWRENHFAQAAIDAALDAQEQAEPVASVACVVPHLRSIIVTHIEGAPFPKVGDWLYTRPPAAQPVAQHSNPVWIRPDDLAKAWIAPHFCRIAPAQAHDFVALHTHRPVATPEESSAVIEDSSVIGRACSECDGMGLADGVGVPCGRCGGSGAQPVAVPADPMDWPLPCDVTVGHVTIKRGCNLRALVSRMQTLHDLVQIPRALSVPAGWALVKQSRLDEIGRLSVDPSESCYEGRGLYDEGKVHQNWRRCSSNLEAISEEMLAIKGGADDYELEQITCAAAPAAPTQAQPQPRGYLLHWPAVGGGRRVIWDESRIAGDAVGCPVEPVYSFGIGQPAQPQPQVQAQPLTDGQIDKLEGDPRCWTGPGLGAQFRKNEFARLVIAKFCRVNGIGQPAGKGGTL